MWLSGADGQVAQRINSSCERLDPVLINAFGVSQNMLRKLFISYAHEDEEYARSIVNQLTAYSVEESMIFLDRYKSGITAGEEWEERIEDEIYEAGAALFLISAHFSNSEYITEMEMPRILESRKGGLDRRIDIYWLKLSEIEVPEDLKKFQGLCDGKSIGALEEGDRQKAIDDASKLLARRIGKALTTREEIYGRIKTACRNQFGLRLSRPKDRGVNSVSFIGYGSGYRAHVKSRYVRAFDRSSDVTNSKLQKHLENIKKLDHSAFIKVYGGLIEDSLQVLVTEYLPRTRTISEQIATARRDKDRLNIDRVRLALSELSLALQAYHDLGMAYGSITPKDVLTELPREGDWRVRLQSIRMSQVDMLSSRSLKLFVFDPYKMSYLAPEQYLKIDPTEKSDQYSLGLLMVETLLCKLPVRVRTLEDMQRKKEYFSDISRLAAELEEVSPRLSGVLVKMLAPDPADRFASMKDVHNALDTAKSAFEDNRRLAKESFRRIMSERDKFLGDFYDAFFCERDDLRAMFGSNLATNGHFEKLEQAILYLLNFSESDGAFEPTILTGTRSMHEALNLRAEDFGRFKDCLMQALKASDAKSPEIQDAWRLSIEPGMRYMMRACSEADAT